MRILALPLILLAACSAQKAPAPPAASSAPAASVATATATAAGNARSVAEENDLYDFSYSYPAAAGLPGLRAWLDADLARKKAELVESARESKAAAKADGIDYRAYADGTEWKVVADLPGWLSLSANLYSDSGGAHPNHGYDALVWDKAAGKRLDPRDLFVSHQALSRAIRARFCDLLDAERSKRRGEKVNRASGDMFDACIDPAEEVVILGSTDGRTFDRVGVLVGPYEAGSYAEGDYDITLPVNEAVLAAVKPAYRAAFALKR